MIGSRRKRAVFVDIDGTLTNERGEIPASAIEAITAARGNGHLVMLATGRSPIEIAPDVEAVGFDGMIAGAGAYALLDGEWLIERELSELQTRRVVAVFEELGLDYSLQGRRGVYPSPGHRARMHRVLTSIGVADPAASAARLHVLDPGEIRFDRAAKAVFDGDDLSAYDAVARRLADEFTVVGGTLPGLGTASGEVSPHGVHKASAMQVVLARLGLDTSDSIAIGDSGNDVEMLLAAGVGIAMGNATAPARAAADESTGDVDEDGLRTAFDRHGLLHPAVQG